MMYLELLLGFLKVGLFSFGGAYAAIPLIRDVVLSYGWIDDEMLSYMIAVSESTPGPIMINLATYIGTEQGGILGALIATFAVVLPSFIIILLLTALLSKVIRNKYIQAALRGLKPCMIGIIMGMGIWMVAQNLFTGTFVGFSWKALTITAMLAIIYFGSRKVKLLKRGISPIMLIVISAAFGIVGFGVL